VGLIVSEEAPTTEKLLTASPLLLEMSKNISWLSGSPVRQQAYLGCEGANAIILKVDCFYVCGNLKCLIYESLVFSPYKFNKMKLSFFIFSQIAAWLRVGDIAIHYMDYTLSDSLINYI
jgi:hypothetical protein